MQLWTLYIVFYGQTLAQVKMLKDCWFNLSYQIGEDTHKHLTELTILCILENFTSLMASLDWLQTQNFLEMKYTQQAKLHNKIWLEDIMNDLLRGYHSVHQQNIIFKGETKQNKRILIDTYLFFKSNNQTCLLLQQYFHFKFLLLNTFFFFIKLVTCFSCIFIFLLNNQFTLKRCFLLRITIK